jgi:hypothetical protein
MTSLDRAIHSMRRKGYRTALYPNIVHFEPEIHEVALELVNVYLPSSVHAFMLDDSNMVMHI